jgi:hypothetical protein
MSSETDHLQIVQAVARSGQPAPALECLCALFRQAVGFDLFTVTLMKQPTDAGGSIVSGYRMYSTIPDAFPAVVEVPFGSKEWTHAMVVEKQILVMDTVEDYRRYYEGWASLKKAGYRSAANLPVVFNGAALGTINLTSKKEAVLHCGASECGRADSGPFCAGDARLFTIPETNGGNLARTSGHCSRYASPV